MRRTLFGSHHISNSTAPSTACQAFRFLRFSRVPRLKPGIRAFASRCDGGIIRLENVDVSQNRTPEIGLLKSAKLHVQCMYRFFILNASLTGFLRCGSISKKWRNYVCPNHLWTHFIFCYAALCWRSPFSNRPPQRNERRIPRICQLEQRRQTEKSRSHICCRTT